MLLRPARVWDYEGEGIPPFVWIYSLTSSSIPFLVILPGLLESATTGNLLLGPMGAILPTFFLGSLLVFDNIGAVAVADEATVI